MRLYENAWPSIYEEIKTWYPVWYREVLEMDTLWRVWGHHLDEVQAGIIQAVDNNFIDCMDAQTITKFENFLRIAHREHRPLAERRNFIKAFVIGLGKIGQQEIKQIIGMFTPGTAEVRFSQGVVSIFVTRESGDDFDFSDIRFVLDNRLPAHLALSATENVPPMKIISRSRLVFHNLNIKTSIRNKSARTYGAIFNGQYLFDGTITFNSPATGITSGINLVNFAVKSKVESRSRMNPKNLKIMGIKVKNTSNLGGSLTKTRDSKFDGTFNFDGSQKFNGKYIINEQLT